MNAGAPSPSSSAVPATSAERAGARPRAARSAPSTGLALAALGAPALLIGVLVWPMLFTDSGLGGDWLHHLWYVWHQGLAIGADRAPSLFLNTSYAVLYPEYAFYGGTIYALAGGLSLILGGSSIAAFVLTYVLGFAAAYGGWYWAGRMAGLGRWPAQAPALLFVTSACYLTLVYGQGDWPEFLAMSTIPLIAAAALSVLCAERLRVPPFLALAAGSVVFFGSHNLTMLWGSTLLAATGLLAVLCIPDARRRLTRRGLIRVAAVMAPAALVNSWFLLPAVAYESHTKIGSQYGVAYETLHYTMHLVSFAHLFTLSRATTVPGTPDYSLALPTLGIAWVLVSLGVVLWSVRRGAWVRALAIFCTMSAALLVLMTHAGLILALPQPYTLLQFSYRLESYVLMGVSASVLAILVLTQSGSRRLRRYGWTVAPILLVSLVGAVQQVDAYPRTSVPRAGTFTPAAEVFSEGYDDYGYAPLPVVYGKTLPVLRFSPAAIHDNRLSAAVHLRPGQLAYTNIGGGPDLLHVSGARVVGRDARYRLVLAVGPSGAVPSAHPRTALATEQIAIAPAQTLPVVLGRLLSLGAAIVLALELAWLLVRRRPLLRRRASGRL